MLKENMTFVRPEDCEKFDGKPIIKSACNGDIMLLKIDGGYEIRAKDSEGNFYMVASSTKYQVAEDLFLDAILPYSQGQL